MAMRRLAPSDRVGWGMRRRIPHPGGRRAAPRAEAARIRRQVYNPRISLAFRLIRSTAAPSSVGGIMGTREQELLAQLNMEPLWMPFTANRQFKANPRLLVAAKDMYYTTHDGRQILDGIAGLWAVNAGHCRQPIVEAIK